MLLGLDDGLVHGYNDLADICFLVAVIVFIIAFFVQLRLKGSLDGMMLAVGLIALSLGWLVL